MAQKDLSGLPMKVTITNNGTEPAAFRYFRVNFAETLAAEDSVIISCATSEETAYYLALADAKIGLTVEAEPAE